MQRNVFVSDSIRGWVFVVGFGVATPGAAGKAATPVKLLTSLSRRFGEAQFYGSMRIDDAYAWARASRGRLVRAFEYDGSEGVTLLDVGAKTPAERSIDLHPPGEEDVLHVAGAWSVDPTKIDESLTTPGRGIVGDLPGGS
jgi:hypothetical protein